MDNNDNVKIISMFLVPCEHGRVAREREREGSNDDDCWLLKQQRMSIQQCMLRSADGHVPFKETTIEHKWKLAFLFVRVAREREYSDVDTS